MKPQTDMRLSRYAHHPSLHAHHASLLALVPLTLLFASFPKTITAQQTLTSASQDPQASTGQIPQTPKPKPSAAHYAPTPLPDAVQQSDQAFSPAPTAAQVTDPAPHPHHVQPHHPVPTLDQTPDPKYAKQTHSVPAQDHAPLAGYARQLNLAPAPQQAPDPGYIPHPYIALNQAPDPGIAQNLGYGEQTSPAPNQAPDSGYAQPSYPAPDQAPIPRYAQDPGYAQNPGYTQNDGQSGYDPQQPQDSSQQSMGPDQLEQLLAPIALYPDALVAQVLAAATYPAQVVGADHWLQSQGNASPDSIAYAAGQQSWDPSLKALTAFPQVLAQMDNNIAWTTDLGNAYYNQPQDVMQTLQVLRQRALGAGTLQNTPQETVSDNQGYLQLAPVNPQVVYVPAYNPWDAYGQPIQPYSGFSLLGSMASFAGSAPLRFCPGVAMGAFNNTPFGWGTWALNWRGGSVFFHHSNYMTHSTTVGRGNFPGRGGPQRGPTPRPMDAYNRGGNFNRPTEGYRPDNRQYGGYRNNQEPYRGNEAPYRGSEFPNRSNEAPSRGNEAPNRAYQQPGTYARPAQPAYGYNRLQPTMPARPQPYTRPNGGYGSSYYGGSNPAYGRPATDYPRQQAYREPTPQFRQAPQYNNFSPRAYTQPSRGYAQPYSAPRNYSEPRSYAQPRNFAQSQPERSGGHGFFGNHGGGNSHESYREPKAPKFKAPKEHGGGHSGGGDHSGGSHHSGGRHF